MESLFALLREIIVTDGLIVENKQNLSSSFVEKSERQWLFIEDVENLSPNIVENRADSIPHVEDVENLSTVFVEREDRLFAWTILV